MKKYEIEIPIAGYVYKEIEAISENEAIDKAFEEGFEWGEVEEIEMFGKLVEGNVCHTYHTEIVIYESDNEEETK